MIRIRIRVCVDEKGNWNAAGWGGPGYGGGVEDDGIADGMPGKSNESWYWVEADVPLPRVELVQGVVRA